MTLATPELLTARQSYELRADAGRVTHVLPKQGGITALCGAMTPAFGDPHGSQNCVECFEALRRMRSAAPDTEITSEHGLADLLTYFMIHEY